MPKASRQDAVDAIVARSSVSERLNGQNVIYISGTDTAKLIRFALADKFPGAKFSVRSDYNSVNISWVDGPSESAVDAITSRYHGGGFDGMIDMEYSSDHWLLPDGTSVFAHTGGTKGSRGSVPRAEGPAEVGEIPGAVRVSYLAKYVFNHPEISVERAAEIAACGDQLDRCRAEGRYNFGRDERITDAQFARMVSYRPDDYPATAWRAGFITAAQAATAGRV